MNNNSVNRLDDYLYERTKLINADKNFKFDNNLQLNDTELKVINIINCIRKFEWDDVWDMEQHIEVGSPFMNSLVIFLFLFDLR